MNVHICILSLSSIRELHKLMKVDMSKESLRVLTDEEFEAYMNGEADDIDIDEIRKHWDNTGRVRREKKVLPNLTLLHSEQPNLHRVLPAVSAMRLTLKAPITIAADDIHKYFFIVCQRK